MDVSYIKVALTMVDSMPAFDKDMLTRMLNQTSPGREGFYSPGTA